MGRIEAGCGKENIPEAIEGADVEDEDSVAEQSKEDVAGPDSTEG